MIEIIYNDSGKKSGNVIVKPPKNIRQIGSPRGRHKIYMEDYVYTYLHSTVFDGEAKMRAAVLIGKSEVSQDMRYTFISGAVSCEDFVFRDDSIIFDESCWEYIYKEVKEYFDSLEVVGWFLGLPGFPLEITPAIEAAHRKYFTGREKVLFLTEPSEGEDIFYAYEQGILQKKEGYYIYYEKNLPMQEYMVCNREKAREHSAGIQERPALSIEDYAKNQTPEMIQEIESAQTEIIQFNLDSEETVFNRGEEPEPEKPSLGGEPEETDEFEELMLERGQETQGKTKAEEALQNYRSTLLEKKGGQRTKKMSMVLYTASAAALVVLCVIGITTLNNYEKMKQVEQTLSLISQSSDKGAEVSPDQPTGLLIESVPGDVKPKADKQPEKKNDTDQKPDPAKTTNKDAAQTDAAVKKDTVDPAKSGTEEPQAGAPSGEKADADNTAVKNKDAADPAKSQDKPEGTAKADAGTKGSGTDAKNDEAGSVAASAQAYLDQGYYVVQNGDRLETICKKIYNTTAIMDKICEVNGIEDGDKILAGQKLKLP